MKAINQEHLKAVVFVQDFKKNNINTVETVKSYDATKKLWTFQKVVIDEKAKSFYDSTRPKKEKKELVLLQPKTTKPKQKVLNPESLRGQIYNLYLSGMSKNDIAIKFEIPNRRVASEISKRNNQIGVAQAQRKNQTRLKVEKLYKKEKNMSAIARKLGIASNTVLYHIKKIEAKKVKTNES